MKYKSAAKANSQDRNNAPKYHAVHVHFGTTNMKQFIYDIPEKYPLTPGDILSVLYHFMSGLLKYTKDGFKVSLGDFGSFKITFNSEGVDNPGNLKPATMIRRKRIIYHSGTCLYMEHE